MRDVAAILLDWYTGELGGEAQFWQLAAGAEPAEARKWLSLAEVEARVAARLVPALFAAGLDIPDGADEVRDAAEHTRALATRPWLDKMRWLEEIALEALVSMTADAKSLPAELQPLAALVLAHETALVEFARLERAGAQSLAPINAFLAASKGP